MLPRRAVGHLSWWGRAPRGFSCPTNVPSPLADDSGDESVSQTDKTELQSTLRTLSSKVEDLSTCNDLIAKHGTALQRSLSELETLRLPAESTEKIKQVNERATLFRITSNAMINVSPRLGIGGASRSWRGASRSWRGVPTAGGGFPQLEGGC